MAIIVPIGLGWGMIRTSAPTFDEPVHLAAGYIDLLSGGYRLNSMDHPPFGEMWAALPLLILRPSAFFQSPDFSARRVYNFADHFLYKNRVSAGKMLDFARFWCLVSWTVLAGAAVLAWSGRLAGPAGLAAGAALFAFCPVLVSNFSLVTTDAASAVFFFLTFWALSGDKRSWARWSLAGVFMGLAMASKFNMAFLPGLVLASLWVGKRLEAPKPFAAGFLLMCALAFFVVAAVYRFESLPLYWEGLSATLRRLDQGRSSFLAGSYSTKGSFFYFPFALAAKAPLPLLAAAAAGLLTLGERKADKFRLIFPAAAYFAAACLSKTQIGVRHILPIFPFLIVLGACGAARVWALKRWGPGVCLAAGLFLAVSVGRAHPHHLAYFNEAVGGPAQGYRYLVDSNLDWGQSLKELGAELSRRGGPPVYLCYFGVADPSYYGIRYLPFGFYPIVDRREGVEIPPDSGPVLLAVSATNLQAAYYGDKEIFAWLKSRTPAFVAGHSIFLYDLTGDPEGVLKLAVLLNGSGYPGVAARLMLKHHKNEPL